MQHMQMCAANELSVKLQGEFASRLHGISHGPEGRSTAGSHHRWYQQHHQQEQLPVFRIRLSYVSKLLIYVYIADLIIH